MSLFSIRHLLSEEFGLIVTIADIVIGLVSLFFPSKRTGKRNYLLLCICGLVLLLLLINYVSVKYVDGATPTPTPTPTATLAPTPTPTSAPISSPTPSSAESQDDLESISDPPPSDTLSEPTPSDEETVLIESRVYHPEGYYQEFPTDKPGTFTVLEMHGAGIVVTFRLSDPLTADEITEASWASDLFAIRDGIKKNVYYEGYDSICWLFMEEGIAAIELPSGLPAGNYSFDFIIYSGNREITGIIPFSYDGQNVVFN